MKARIIIALAVILIGLSLIKVVNHVGRPVAQLESNATIVAQMDGTDQSAIVNHVNQDGSWVADLFETAIAVVTGLSVVGIMYRPIKTALQEGTQE